jgi:hypothetical protein
MPLQQQQVLLIFGVTEERAVPLLFQQQEPTPLRQQSPEDVQLQRLQLLHKIQLCLMLVLPRLHN